MLSRHLHITEDGLRDYGTAQWEGGDPNCDHKPKFKKSVSATVGNDVKDIGKLYYQDVCKKCGAIRVDKQVGIEKTPEEYVQKLVEVFNEVRRVLTPDGTLFLNIGDSYYGSGKGPTGYNGIGDQSKRQGFSSFSDVQCATSYDTSGKVSEDYLSYDYSFENLCGVCQQALRHKSHTDDRISPMLIASLFLSNHERMEFLHDRFPTLDFSRQVNRILIAISDFLHSQDLSFEQILSFQKSMPSEFYRQLLALCLQRGNYSSCLLCGRSLTYDVPQSFHKSFDEIMQYWHIHDIALPFVQQGYHNQYIDMVSEYYNEILSYFKLDIQPQCTSNNRTNLKPKDLIGIPWMMAFALRASGWWLRQDIIWHKPGCMPESVTDRCTKSHEYIFLLSKSQKYYFDQEAIQEKSTYFDTDNRHITGPTVGGKSLNGVYAINKSGVYQSSGMKNKRSVWTVNLQPTSEAHFAVFPQKLIEPMIRAGCPKGGIVLDPFIGSGTTGIVARKLDRNFIGIELNPEYVKLAEKRIKRKLGIFL